jgi:HEAT repeat protein
MKMTITMKDVLAQLEPDELDYEAAAEKLGTDALPFLKELVNAPNTMMASKAAYLASLIKSETSVLVLQDAAHRTEPTIRVAAASGLRNLSEENANKVTDIFIQDKDAGVRKVMLNSISRFKSPKLKAKIKMISEKDSEPFIREIAAKIANRKK